MGFKMSDFPEHMQAEIKDKIRGRGQTVRRVAGAMNKLEARYSAHLDLLVKTGEIVRYDFDCERLRIGKKCFYEPDFRIVRPDVSIEFHEVKGFWRDDARVKIKVAAELHPYKFVAVQWKQKQWVYEEF